MILSKDQTLPRELKETANFRLAISLAWEGLSHRRRGTVVKTLGLGDKVRLSIAGRSLIRG
jgi:hypothetical protein